MDIKRYIITEILPDRILVKGRDWMDFTYDWQDPLLLDPSRVRAVEYNNVTHQFYFRRATDDLIIRQPREGDIVMVRLDENQNIKFWTYIEHYDEVDARQPRCRHADCTSILGEFNDVYCEYHDPDYQEEYCNGCNQPEACCTCAEIESLRRHNADPATAGSWWTP